jgi:hypothetical protein
MEWHCSNPTEQARVTVIFRTSSPPSDLKPPGMGQAVKVKEKTGK